MNILFTTGRRQLLPKPANRWVEVPLLFLATEDVNLISYEKNAFHEMAIMNRKRHMQLYELNHHTVIEYYRSFIYYLPE